MKSLLDVNHIAGIVFDFDGVLTDNRVYVDETGRESVCCNRSDGLAFDILRQQKLPAFILSTETNPVVRVRGQKLRVPVVHGQRDKGAAITALAEENGLDLERVLFVGNDVNDLPAMRRCGCSACPADSHPHVRAVATYILQRRGGDGVAREVVEELLGLELAP